MLIEGNYVCDIIGEAISFCGEWENAGGGLNYANCSTNVVVLKNTVLRTVPPPTEAQRSAASGAL